MKWTIHKAASEWLIDSKTLTKRLRAIGHDPKPRQTFSTSEISAAVCGDLTAERIRAERARADLMEQKRKENDRELVRLDDVQEMLQQMMAPIRSRLNAMPTELANRVNPTDPQLAKDAAQRWVDEAVKTVREEGLAGCG